MPLQKCTKDGKSGWKAGPTQSCHTGPDAKQKALKQLQAIKANSAEEFADELKESFDNGDLTMADLSELLTDGIDEDEVVYAVGKTLNMNLVTLMSIVNRRQSKRRKSE